jgi:hypothetical protein
MTVCVRNLMAGLLAIVVSGCGDSATSSTKIGSETSFSGSWTGTLGTAYRVTWSASQSGPNVSGPVTLSATINGQVVTATGTFNWVLAGTNVSLTMNVPTGSVSGFATCSFTGNGPGTATASNNFANSISGNLTMTYGSCQGFSSVSSETLPISLTRS